MDQDVWSHNMVLNEYVPTNKRHLLLMEWSLCGYSKSALRTGFKMGPFHLDAGHSIFGKWNACLISHGHADHVFSFASFFLVKELDGTQIVLAPKPDLLRNIADATLQSNYNTDKFHISAQFTEARPGLICPINIGKNKFRAQIISMDHSIPTVGYCILKSTMRLNPILVPLRDEMGTKDFSALLKRIKQGESMDGIPVKDITVEHWIPQFCYLTDTSIKGITDNIEVIREYPIIIVECTFYDVDDLEHANEKKHIHWAQLEPFIRVYSDILWILIHSSTRYKSRTDILAAIPNYPNYPNCIIWASPVTKSESE